MAEIERTPDGTLEVASYNVHGFVGRDRRFDPARTFRVIEELGADLVALQEVHALPGPSGSGEVLEELAGALGFRLLLGPTLLRGGGDYGNALLTRLPLDGLSRIDLSIDGREPRGALDVRVRASDASLRFVAVHLGLRAAERRAQVARLDRSIAEGDGSGQGPPPSLTVLLGDFNEWSPWSRRLAPLARRVGPFSRRPTFPSRMPSLPLDRIAVRPAEALLSVRPWGSSLARDASDHLPLRARLRVPTLREPTLRQPTLRKSTLRKSTN